MNQQAAPAKNSHIPVMLDEAIAALNPVASGDYIDGTFGNGGYSKAVLAHGQTRVFAIDRDPQAIKLAQALRVEHPGRLIVLPGKFSDMAALLEGEGINSVDGIMLDIGVSSMQLDDPARGFSFQHDGPLDMRMSAEGETAADVVNTLDEQALTKILRLYGEEKAAKKIARAIVRQRDQTPLSRTKELADLVARALGPGAARRKKHPATRTFQALRIFVNRELEELVAALHAAETLLRTGGRLVVVTFHSLEDRIVKRFFAERMGRLASISRHMPALDDQPAPSFFLLKPLKCSASATEIKRNPRARSAILRAGERTNAPVYPLNPENLDSRRLC